MKWTLEVVKEAVGYALIAKKEGGPEWGSSVARFYGKSAEEMAHLLKRASEYRITTGAWPTWPTPTADEEE